MIELNKVYEGNNLDVMSKMDDNSVDSIVTDPPYGLKFMGKKWDYDVPSVEIWQECLRVLKPGGFLLSFAGTRTYHRMTVNIEDAGFEIRDMIAWVYGSGFPKSHNISKGIDKKNNTYIKGEISPNSRDSGESPAGCYSQGVQHKTIDIPQSDEAKQWDGWDTALKPALEPICVARKPLSEKTVASNVLKHGTGGINIDGCRIEYQNKSDKDSAKPQGRATSKIGGLAGGQQSNRERNTFKAKTVGRFPANLIHDGSEEVEALFPNTKSGKANIGDGSGLNTTRGIYGAKPSVITSNYADEGSASRFFYCAKASRQDRNEGLDELPTKNASELTGRQKGSKGLSGSKEHSNATNPFSNSGSVVPSANYHPTVKPTKLMRYLVRLVTPPDGTVLDPFAGSGSTGKACVLENLNYILIELEKASCNIAIARIAYVANQPKQLGIGLK